MTEKPNGSGLSAEELAAQFDQAQEAIDGARLGIKRFTSDLESGLADTGQIADGFTNSLKSAGEQMKVAGAVHEQTARDFVSVMDSMQQNSDQIASSITSALTDVVVEGRDVGEALKSIMSSVSDTALQAALNPLEGFISTGVNAGFSSLSGLFEGAFGSLFSSFSGLSGVTPFANGGVLGSPTYFPLAEGLGVAGEAGPEAVLPLTRGDDGRLGVAASGQSGRSGAVTVNIQTQDIQSFQRSEAQISAAIARAVTRGQKSL